MDDHLAQGIHCENAERTLLASFVAGFTGVQGRQVRSYNPQAMEHALKIALSVQEAEKQEEFNESFYTSFDNSVRLQSHPPVEHATKTASHVAQLTRRVRSVTRRSALQVT